MKYKYFFIIPKVSVVGFSNSTYKINNWKKENCAKRNPEAEANCEKKEDCLKCKQTFHLHACSGLIKCKKLIEAWIKTVRRQPFDKKGPWQIAASDLVCSSHFVDGLASDENPIPILFLGYDSNEKISRRTWLR